MLKQINLSNASTEVEGNITDSTIAGGNMTSSLEKENTSSPNLGHNLTNTIGGNMTSSLDSNSPLGKLEALFKGIIGTNTTDSMMGGNVSSPDYEGNVTSMNMTDNTIAGGNKTSILEEGNATLSHKI